MATPRRWLGRPRVKGEIAQLTVRMAQENPGWDYTTIRGALHNLGQVVAHEMVRNILKEHGIEPAPERRKRMPWSTFLKSHWDCIAAADLFSVLFGTTSMLAVTATFEKKGHSFERLLLTPIPPELLMLAKTSGAMIFGVANAPVPIVMAASLTDLSAVVPAIVLIAVTSTFLGLFIDVSVSKAFSKPRPFPASSASR